MVQILEDNTRPTTGQMFGQAFANAGQAVGQGYGQLLKGQQENKKLSGLGFDVAGISDPDTRRQVLQDQMTFGRKMKQSKIASDVNKDIYGGGQLASGGRAPASSLGAGQQDEYGNFPEPETEGRKRPILPPEIIVSTGQEIARRNREAGNPMSDEEGIQLARTRNDENRQYNQDVEADKEQRVRTQRNYGDIGEKHITEVFPDATPEMRSKFRKMGEDAARTSTSEGEIDRQIAQEARKFKNMYANIKDARNAPVLTEKLKGNILGTNIERQEAVNDMRLKLAPLLNEGFYDTARALLAEKGYSPESVESIISDLGEGSKKALSQMPDVKLKQASPSKRTGFNPIPNMERVEENYELTRDNMKQAFESEPSVNLVLLRKGYQEKGVDWRTFKNNINDMIYDGTLKLNDEQFNQLNFLDEPPYNELEQVLKDIKVID